MHLTVHKDSGPYNRIVPMLLSIDYYFNDKFTIIHKLKRNGFEEKIKITATFKKCFFKISELFLTTTVNNKWR